MGHPTDFIGHIDIDPPLNTSEQHYLTAFSESRRWARPGGPYDVPGNPAVERTTELDNSIQAQNQVADGQPGLWCQWVPCWQGCCLTYNGQEKFYDATEWMRYLIDHLLAPHAAASHSERAWFDDFTFDHRTDGTIAGCRRDNKELFLIVVENNAVRQQVLRAGEPEFSRRDLLAYEKYLDDDRGSRKRGTSRRKSSRGNVIDLYDARQ